VGFCFGGAWCGGWPAGETRLAAASPSTARPVVDDFSRAKAAVLAVYGGPTPA